MVAGVFFSPVSLVIESVLKSFSAYVQAMFPGGIVIAVVVYSIFDFVIVVLLFASIYKFLPDVKIRWRDVWIGAVMTAILFTIGKWALGLYLGSGTAASAYGAASSLITLLFGSIIPHRYCSLALSSRRFGRIALVARSSRHRTLSKLIVVRQNNKFHSFGGGG